MKVCCGTGKGASVVKGGQRPLSGQFGASVGAGGGFQDSCGGPEKHIETFAPFARMYKKSCT